MLYKVVPNTISGIYKNQSNERVDLITAEVRFYCPGNCSKTCGNPDTCCRNFNTLEEAITYYNLTNYEV